MAARRQNSECIILISQLIYHCSEKLSLSPQYLRVSNKGPVWILPVVAQRDWRFGVRGEEGMTALKVAIVLELLIGYHGLGFRASDWSALICI